MLLFVACLLSSCASVAYLSWRRGRQQVELDLALRRYVEAQTEITAQLHERVTRLEVAEIERAHAAGKPEIITSTGAAERWQGQA